MLLHKVLIVQQQYAIAQMSFIYLRVIANEIGKSHLPIIYCHISKESLGTEAVWYGINLGTSLLGT